MIPADSYIYIFGIHKSLPNFEHHEYRIQYYGILTIIHPSFPFSSPFFSRRFSCSWNKQNQYWLESIPTSFLRVMEDSDD